ncbi:RagB/SusD family nutrient uptake outer membrane protein [Chitinophaga pinensis]|uniref:RagB/SusD domain protein n=1 Tax=Chitinophaga pinensis (strain ATCC 43595 / DSM 2588 / LMG 13176 / NBRC 15968 / NCIMB 11800 / UQM 2034) TaxID=485918 RepID=A0A979GWS9_CHIPD|nr:RagB/SusD family nutrient uptake outer membrane protein [Chitinophaga pinensis]ACU60680.1 RagB/SusD domain protein [Chitinophaga pinensis DSM 2588]
MKYWDIKLGKFTLGKYETLLAETAKHFSVSKYLFFPCVLLIIVSLTSCSKFVEVNPPITNINGENVYNENGTAIAVLTGIYVNMSKADVNFASGWLTNTCFTTGLTGDELDLWDKNNTYYAQYYYNNISPQETTWGNVYTMIFIANSAIERLPNGKYLTSEVKNQLLGEAKFIRALSYFYLFNTYGDIPLTTTTDYKVNSLLPRSPKKDVYDQIVRDLIDAQQLLKDNFLSKDGVSITTERIRPCKWAATALLARVYLYLEKYNEAEQQASDIIANTSLFELVDLNSVFVMNNKEAIWQLQPVGIPGDKTANTREGQVFKLLPPWPDFGGPAYLTDNFVKSFEANDLRRDNWTNSIVVNGKKFAFPYKYKIGLEEEPTKEYSTVLRLGEQYLIRAEARIQQGKLADGISDLNVIRMRATNVNADPADQLPQLSLTLSKNEALLAVENERKHELFTEWGHRWFDLKRTGRIDQVLPLVKSGWQSTDQLFPLPANEVNGNPNLVGHQNPGYN